MTISGRTKLIAHLGYPTESFKAPMIYNPYFERYEVDAVVVPMGCKAEDYPAFLKLVFKLSNIHGALVTMPHKVTTVPLLDEVLTTAKVAGACNAIRLGPGGTLVGDMFDGEGFVRGILRKGRALAGSRVLVVGSGGVGSAIVASLAKAGVAELSLFDAHVPTMNSLADRLRAYYPALKIEVGMKDGDPLPMDVDRIAPSTFVGEVVMKQEITPFLAAAKSRGCQIQIGTDMLFEQIPAYLEFFGFRSTTPEELRTVAQISY
jgi:shikimate dehydrogenase